MFCYERLLVHCSSFREGDIWGRVFCRVTSFLIFQGKSSQPSQQTNESHALLLAPSHIWRAIMLSYHMASKMLGLLAGVAALTTSVWFFPSMNALVCNQITDLSGTVVALVTFERFLAWMDPHVALQGFIIRTSEVTLIANIGLLSGMCPHMSPKVTSCCAGVIT